VRTLSLVVNIDDPSPILPQFLPRQCISMQSSKYRSNKARGPIVAVKSSNDVPIESGYKHEVAKC